MARTASLTFLLLSLLSNVAVAASNDDWKQYTLTSLVMAEDRAADGKTLSFPLRCQDLPGNTRVPSSLKSCQMVFTGSGIQVTGVSKGGQKHVLTSQGIRKKNSGINVDLVRMSYRFVQDTYLQAYVRQTQLNIGFYLTTHDEIKGILGPCSKVPGNGKLPPEVLKCQVSKKGGTYTIQATGVRGSVATVTGVKGKIVLKSR